MRATQASIYRTLLTNLNRSTSNLNDLRIMAATGKKVLKPSDEPAAIRPMLDARSNIRQSSRYLDALGNAGDRFSNYDSHLTQIENLLVSAKETLIAAGNGSLGPEDLQTLGARVTSIHDSIFALANAQVEGKYIFAGRNETERPFTDRDNPSIYNGNNGAIEIEIGPNERVRTNIGGGELFRGDGGGINIFQVLKDIEDALASGDQATALTQLDNLEAAANQVRGVQSQMGNLAARVDTAKFYMEGMRIDMEAMLSRYEDADIVEVLTKLTQQEQAFQAALAITGKVSELSILNYLR